MGDDKERHCFDGAMTTMKTTTDASNEYETSSFYDNDIILLGDYVRNIFVITTDKQFFSCPCFSQRRRDFNALYKTLTTHDDDDDEIFVHCFFLLLPLFSVFISACQFTMLLFG